MLELQVMRIRTFSRNLIQLAMRMPEAGKNFSNKNVIKRCQGQAATNRNISFVLIYFVNKTKNVNI